MTHLTTKHILQFVDGALDYATQVQCTSHLAVCEHCRREVELQKLITKIARREQPDRMSSDFVKNVMGRVVSLRHKTWKTRLVDNLGNVFAMTMVLAILGYALSNPSMFQAQDQSAQRSIIPQEVSDTYARVMQSFAQRTSAATEEVVTSSGKDNSRISAFIVLSLAILVAADQFVFKRFAGMKAKH